MALTVYQRFTCVHLIAQPSPSTALSLAVSNSASRLTVTSEEGVHCQGASHKTVASYALPLGYRWLHSESPTGQTVRQLFKALSPLISYLLATLPVAPSSTVSLIPTMQKHCLPASWKVQHEHTINLLDCVDLQS